MYLGITNYNYIDKSEGHYDITDIIDFSKYSHVVMIGYFRTLAKKIDDNNIPLYVFDLENVGERLTDMQLQLEYLGNADAVIIGEAIPIAWRTAIFTTIEASTILSGISLTPFSMFKL